MSYPNPAAIPSSQSLYRQASSLLLYQGVLSGAVGQAFLSLLQSLSQREDELTCIRAYSNWFKTLAASGESWQDYLMWRILWDDNPFSRAVQRVALSDLPHSLVAAVKQDLHILQIIYKCTSQQLSLWVQEVSQSETQPVVWDVESQAPSFLPQESNWANSLPDLANYYRDNGAGLLAQYRALRWQSGELVGIPHPDPIELGELVGYESQQETLIKNTEFLLAGYPALHVLLYGSRGSGKSSLVKALLQKYSSRGLRLIEVAKSDLKDLSLIVDKLREVPQKFIIFVDDLSFEEDDEAFKALKVVLEGSVTARSQNIVVYATSNRRHLIREYFSDRPRPRDNDEVHAWDTLEEKLSFCDRFGLTLTFEPANQDTYLKIVRHLADLAKINLPQEELDYRARQWATRHNGRCGRSARQFIDFLTAEIST
ncbi:MAG TPA: AAA+ family ATPase [Cyanobacteria bacterium UBA11149]|nr:AAA+ family ATPase [Cyanobacteria bacterium UBA11367]HBE61079.1 AAA+ family ATPase [Cyanobacteria bacterium UBA11366]HBK62257.1 AAA+ family ATPase [Cyanobacteria bacterium UBA11166]HBR74265.1 AAA+ family ATPase [Cyanobacteria bacterium UBA11159]HBS68370.1 AAA+ family ATPase [Cyanobacteria bacterium UBA11153]HBW89475.1 AAA+ family ATPase [Cyanobacteria bacterium UBA11149]HCA95002.1 AAA+ family ATPase [Cyanobacteria bacterium UBA9226]